MPNETRADDPVYCREGQGESLGPSVLSSLLERLEAWDRAEEMMRDRARMSEIRMWRDAEPYWATYGSQNREAVPRWTAYRDMAEGRSVSLADLQPTYSYAVRPTTTRERGEQMRFSGKPDPLTSEEKVTMEQFYRKVLRDGFAQWPLEGLRLPIFIDGKVRRIYSDTRWSCQEEYIYIGSRRDEGSGDFSSPAARLAVTTTLMGMTGHSSSPELIGLLSERLAKVMAGVYDSVVKPLAETSDSRPVRRMAWSASGGLASWIDGEWVGLTGEPVTVGAGWTVIDSEEGPIEEGLPEVTPSVLPTELEEIPLPF